jgi:hypothetical protein
LLTAQDVVGYEGRMRTGIRIPMEKLTETAFLQLVMKLGRCTVSNPEISYRLGRLHSTVQAECAKLTAFQMQMHKKYGVKNAKGEVEYRDEMKPNLYPKFKTKAKQKAMGKACDKFIKGKTFIVRIKPIPFEAMTMLSPQDWLALDGTDLVEGLPGVA